MRIQFSLLPTIRKCIIAARNKYSVQFSRSVVSDFLRPHGMQHTRHPCPSPTPGTYSNSCPSSGWCHSAISSSIFPFPSCLQSFPASGSFLMSQFFESGGQTIGVSASASVLSMNIQDWFPLGWLVGSPCSPRDSQESSPTPQFKSMYVYVLNSHWKDWWWSWNSSTLATWWEELTHWKRPWCWERLKAGGEGDVRGWDGWMASLTWWTWVWVSSRSWWWTGKPGVLQSMGLQRVGHDWVTELNWTELRNQPAWEITNKPEKT